MTLDSLEFNWRDKTIHVGIDCRGQGPTILMLPALSSISTRSEMRPLGEQLASIAGKQSGRRRLQGNHAWLAGRLARADFCTAHCLSTPGIRLFHIADDRPATVIYVHMLDADKLLSAITQASKNLNLGRISPHQTSRSRSEGDCDIREDLPKPKKR
jgi:hypothetical protein